MNKSPWKDIIKDRFSAKTGKPFQELCWDVLLKLYPDFQPVKMNYDKGCDGYCNKERIFFACYAPEDNYETKETIKKIKGDYKSFWDNWKDKGFEKWVFVTKKDLIGAPHQTLMDINNNGDGVVKENWGITKLVDQVVSLNEQDIQTIFNLPRQYNVITEQEEKDLGVIEEVFNYVLSKIKAGEGADYKFEQHLHLTQKIALNFPEGQDGQAVHQFFITAFEKLGLIQKRFADLSIDLQQDCHSHIFSKYYENKRAGLDNYHNLQELFDYFTPSGKRHDPQYTNLTKAFVLFFFDDCTIFEKTAEENKITS